MSLPLIPNIPRMQDYTQEFKGYNHNMRIAENEFYDENNLSADNYPVLSTRKGRSAKSYGGEILGAVGRADEFWCVVKEGDAAVLYKNAEQVQLTNGDTVFTLSTEKKQMLFFGAYLLIFPDCISLNVTSGNAEYITAEFPRSFSYTIQLQAKNTNGDFEDCNDILPVEESMLEVDSSYDGVLCAVFSNSDPYSLIGVGVVDVNTDNGRWSFTDKKNADDYRLKVIVHSPFSLLFIKKIDLSDAPILPKTRKVILNENNYYLERAESDYNIFYINQTVMVFPKIQHEDGETYGVYYDSVYGDFNNREKRMALPELDMLRIVTPIRDLMCWDHITECQNRLWACRHGENAFGEMVNEIYATKLGTFNEWYTFDKTADDSYVASLGTPGNFTGVSVVNQNPVFFKEDYIHKVYVSATGAHQIVTLEVPGPEETSSKSVAHVNGNVIYKTRNDVVLFDGSAVSSISYALGSECYKNAVAGASRNKYVMYCCDTNDKEHIFTYDTSLGIWHKEKAPDTAIKDMVLCDGKLRMIAEKAVYVHDDDSVAESIPFMFESGEIGFGMPDKKYISRIDLRLSLEMGARMRILMQYDSDGIWVRAGDLYGTEKIPKPISIPILPRRCDHFKMRVSGEGKFNLYSITKILEQGE